MVRITRSARPEGWASKDSSYWIYAISKKTAVTNAETRFLPWWQRGEGVGWVSTGGYGSWSPGNHHMTKPLVWTSIPQLAAPHHCLYSPMERWRELRTIQSTCCWPWVLRWDYLIKVLVWICWFEIAKENEKRIPKSSARQFVFCVWQEIQCQPPSNKDSGCTFVYMKISDEIQLGYVLSDAATILKLARSKKQQ